MSKLYLTLTVPLLALAPALCRADMIFGIYAGAGTWQNQTSGEVTSGPTDVDVDDDLGLDDELNNVYYLAVEHPLPGLPNIRLNYADVAVTGDNVLSRTIEFNGQVFDVSDAVASDVAFEQADAVFYYEVLDNVLSLDLGMAARGLDGEFEVVSESGGVSRAEFQGVVPLLYGRLRADLPLTGLWVGGDAMGLAYDGNRLLDVNVQVGWESTLGFGAEAGWRRYRLEIEDLDDIDQAGIDLDGPYLALNYHF